MGTRHHTAERCPRCRLHVDLCACAAMPTLPLATRLVLVAHFRELRKPTATGPLALEALPHHELHVRGEQDAPLDLTHLHEPGRRVLLLFPGDAARELSPELLAEDPRPVTLVVPEGSWRQAAKLARRIPGLPEAEQVILPTGAPTRWGVRREPKAGGLATLEAIARALGVIEGPEVQAALETWFDVVTERTHALRRGGHL